MAGPSGATPVLALPFPIPDDTVDIPRDIKALADKLDPLVPTIPYGTSFPASPANGQLAVLVNSTTDPVWQWLFRYNANSTSPYKWEFIGGSDHVNIVTAGEATSSTSFADLATVGPSFNVPRSGEYHIDGSVRVNANNIQGQIGLKVGAATTVDVGSVLIVGTAIDIQVSIYPTVYIATAGDVAKFQYRVNSGSATFSFRSLRARPKRVS